MQNQKPTVRRSSELADKLVRDMSQHERLRIATIRGRAYDVGMALGVYPPHLRPSPEKRFLLMAARNRSLAVETFEARTLDQIETTLHKIEAAAHRDPNALLPTLPPLPAPPKGMTKAEIIANQRALAYGRKAA